MKAVFAATINNADPLAALEVGELPEPQPRPFSYGYPQYLPDKSQNQTFHNGYK